MTETGETPINLDNNFDGFLDCIKDFDEISNLLFSPGSSEIITEDNKTFPGGGTIMVEPPTPKKKAQKREGEAVTDGPLPPKVKKPSSSVPKSALCTLHEMYRGLVFNTVSQEGPVHAPTFTVSVEVNGTIFEGKGRNKKMAKHNAAEAALRSLVQFKNPTRDGINLCSSGEMMDFTSDVSDKDVNSFDASKAGGSTGSISNGSTNGLVNKKTTGSKSKIQPCDKSPVMLLNELHPHTKYEVVADNGEQYNKYTMVVIIDGKRFEGTGPSKKLSKAAAARSALAMLYNLSFSPAATPSSFGKTTPGTPRDAPVIPQVFVDHISKLVIQKFTDLMENNSTHARRKVLAGIVLSNGYDQETCRVLTVTTGTKCINGERMSVNGSVLNDSHAEIVSRRCLNNFLFSELEKHFNSETLQDSIFEKKLCGSRFQLKEDYKFHLFINTAPCGDSRIFSPHEYSVDKHPNRKARGQLRTKIESGEGTIPVKSCEGIQTWDGVLQGERLLTMSCSDKIAKWNVVGLQGALLSQFIDPIYLDTIVLGSLFHPDHLYRAICGRIENTIHALPPPFRLNKPKMSLISSKEVRQPGKAPNFSVNWTTGDSGPEIVNAMTGVTEQNEVSRLAKCRLFVRYLRLFGKNSMSSLRGCPRTYGECKELAADYQVAKKQLYEAFVKAELGTWVKKPIEADQFEWSEETLQREAYPPQ